MKMEPTVSSETSAIRTQTPGNYPKRSKLQEIFHFQNTQTISGAQPVSYSVGNRVLLPGVKQLGRGADHSPSLSDKVKNQ